MSKCPTFTYVVSCASNTKLVSVAKKEELLLKTKTVFDVSGEWHMEYYYKPCDEYVIVRALSEVPDEGKLRLVRSAVGSELIQRADTVSLDSNTNAAAVDDSSPRRSNPASPALSFDRLMMVEDTTIEISGTEAVDPLALDGSDQGAVAAEETGRSPPVAPKRKPLTRDVCCSGGTDKDFWDHAISGLSSRTRQAIATPEAGLSDTQWQELIHNAYVVAQERGMEPDSATYLRLACELCDTYKLRPQGTLEKSLTIIRDKLRRKFRNERYKANQSQPPKKRKCIAQAKCSAVGLPRYIPETETAHESAAKATFLLRKEGGDHTPEEIKSLKGASFYRRRMLILAGAPVSEVLQEFPWLRCESEIWEEFERICDGDRQLLAEQKMQEVMRTVAREMRTETDQEAMDALLSVFSLKAQALDGGKVCMHEGQVKVEEEVIGSYSNTQQGMLLWAVAHSVFAINPTRRAGSFLRYVQAKCLRVFEGRLPDDIQQELKFLNVHV